MRNSLLAVALLLASLGIQAEENVVTTTTQPQSSTSVTFAYEAGAELVSTYIWRGQYTGGLSIQPDFEIGYDGKNTAFRFGVWGSFGASDWKFAKGKEFGYDEDGEMYNLNTFFVPEVNIFASFSFFGAHIGTTHLDYFTFDPNTKKYDYTYNWEFEAGYDFGELLDFPLYINWYTNIGLPNNKTNCDFIYDEVEVKDAHGNLILDEDGEPIMEETQKRAWSSYLEIGYTHTFPYDITLDGKIGMSPWRSDDVYMNQKFAVINLSLRLEKEWEFDACTLTLFGEGSLNPDLESNKIILNTAGTEKQYLQPLSGNIGLGVWF